MLQEEFPEAGMRVHPGAHGGTPHGKFEKIGLPLADALPGPADGRGIRMELVPEGEGGGIHEMGPSGLGNPEELLTPGSEGIRQFPEGLHEQVRDLHHGDVTGGGEGIVR